MNQHGGNMNEMRVNSGIQLAQDNNASKGPNKWLLMALGGVVGLAGGVGVGYSIGKREALRRAKETLKTVRREAHQEGWNEGYEQASAAAQEWIDENILVVPGETTEEIAENTVKMVNEKKEAEAEKEREKEEAKANSDQKGIASDCREKASSDTIPSSSASSSEPRKNTIPESQIRKLQSEYLDDTETIKKAKIERLYSQGLSNFDIARITGYPESAVRYFTKDMVRPGFAASDEDIDNYDLSIDDDGSEEAREMTEARERYLDEVDRYLGNPDEGPHYISQKEFEEEVYLEKVYVDYFEKDKVFVSNDDAGMEMDDPVTDFGTADGDELFANNPNREDPDIVTMRNFKMNAVYEITRFHEAYTGVRDGSAFVNGSTADNG